MARKLTIGDLLFRLGYENEDKFVADLEKVMGRAEKTTEKAGDDAGKKGGRAAGRGFSEQFKATFSGAAIGSFIGTALSTAFQGALQYTAKFIGDSVREFAVYEQGLLQLKLAGETNLGALSKRIQDTAKATKVFSATDVSLAVGELVKAGYDAETAFALVETGALGAASEVDAVSGKFGDLSATAGQLGNILRALGYDTSQSARVMDVLSRAAQDSNLDVSDLVEIVARVGPTAKLAGLEIEDLAAQAAVLSNNGMEASLIGTGLRSVLQSLINPSGAMKKQLDDLGISLVDGNGNLRDFNEVLDGLHELTQRGGEGLQILTQATGSYGSTAAASLGSASETVKEFRTNLEGAEGASKELADTMRGSAAGAAAELAARLADARAELGEQLMPILLDLNATVLPALVGLLGQIVQKWTDWQFIITGTTTAIQQSQEALQQSVLSGLGDELGQALLDLMDARQARAEAEQALADNQFGYGLGHRRRTQALEAAIAVEEQAQARYDELLAQRRIAQQHEANLANWSVPGTQFGPQVEGEAQATAAAVNNLVESYRNLETIEAELAAARQQHAASTSAAEETRWAAEVRRLEAEREARLAVLKVAQETAKAAGSTRDPLLEEAQRVQNDLQRLKLSYEQGTLSREAYVEAQEAHLRRLDGLYGRVASPEQSLAVLRAQKAFLDELVRLEEQAGKEMEAIRAVNKDREDEQRFPSTLTGEGIARLKRRIANRERAIVQAEQEAREQAMAEGYRASQHRVQDRDARPSITSLFATPEDVRKWAEEQGRAEREAEAKNQAELARLREAALEKHKKAMAEAFADVHNIRAQANQLGIAVTQALRAGTLEGLQELEAELVRVLQQLGDDPSAAPLMGLLTTVRTTIGSVTEATRAQESEQRRLIRAHNEYTESLKRARQAEIDMALGSTVRLTQAKHDLGMATREELVTALEEQIRVLERLLPTVAEGTAQWHAYAAALIAAKGALDDLNAPRKLTLNPTATIDGRDQGEWARDINSQAEAMANDLMNVAKSFPLAIVEGIRSGDIASALENALGGAADYFLDMMLKSILGPITEELTSAIAKSLTAKAATDGAAGATGALGALGPTGLVLGGVALLASMLVGAGRQRQAATERNQQSVRAAVSGAPSVTYNISAEVNVAPAASFGDPRWEAELRAFIQGVATDLYRRVPRTGGGS